MMSTPPAAPVVLTREGSIAEIRFNRPEVLNAMDLATAIAFRDAAALATRDADIRVILLTGAGRAFMAGGDLAYFRAAAHNAPDAARELIEPIHAAIEALIAAPQPVLASVQGSVAGAGMSVALAADLVIAADNAVFNMAYAKVANSPDCAASWSLPRVVGLRKALEIMLLSENLDAAEALRLGLINRVAPLGALPEESRQLARRLADSAPLALRSIKRLLRESSGHTLQQQMSAEAESFASNAGSRDFREALEAFFGKRKPVFEGR